MSEAAFIHPHALIEPGATIGAGTRVWAFAHVLGRARLGAGCNICDHTFIENDVVVGDRVTVKCGVQLWDGVEIGDEVFIGPNATFTNDKYPKSGNRGFKVLHTRVGRGASIGANATILPGITIGEGAVVGAGAVVTRDVPPNAVVTGNPARVTGCSLPEAEAAANPRTLNVHTDERGSLAVAEVGRDLPFTVRRVFWVYGLEEESERGRHAHRECAEYIVCLKGRAQVTLDDGTSRVEYRLESPETGVYVPPATWITYRMEPETVLLVLASHPFDTGDHIKDYGEFLAFVAERGCEP